MGGRRMRGPLSQHDIPLSHKEYAIAFFLRTGEKLWLKMP
jgi:hypothetical protein